MKILQIIPTLSATAGGTVEGLIQQGVEMERCGHDVRTLCLDDLASVINLDPRLRSSAVYCLGPSRLGYGWTSRLEPWLREHATEFDALLIHGMWTFHGYCVAKVARSQGIPYVIYLHGMLDPWFARQYPLKHLKKWLYWPWAEYRTLRDARLVLFTTAEELALARQSFWLYKVRERLVGYGIKKPDVEPSHARATFLTQFPHLAATQNFVYLSRLHPKKGCDLLIRSFAKVAASNPELHLVLAGPGDENWIAMLKELVSQFGLGQRVTFTGMLTGEVKWGAYDVADAFVLPSHQENFGIVVAEALAWGVPVLTTNKVNIWREIKAAKAGIIHADTQDGSDQLLEDWLALSKNDRDAMRAKAKICFAENFEVTAVTQNLIEALKDAMGPMKLSHTYKSPGKMGFGGSKCHLGNR